MTDNEQKLKDALEELVIKLELMIPYLDSLCLMSHNHGFPYSGPNMVQELENARRVLREFGD
jgi:hypothetical protein